jgi:hypothetical protein
VVEVTDPSGEGRDGRPVDFDLHGHVGLRLLDARPSDVATVLRQLGPLRSPLDRAPDITVRFVDRIEDPEPVTFVGWPDAGFTTRGFYVLQGRGNVPGRARIPFQDIGKGCHIECERALPAVPLLLAIVNLTALGNGILPLHASAFVHRGRGVLVTGWSKGGKTETLLALADAGASYIGDEWVYVTRDGELLGVPEPVRLWRWQLRQLPAVWQRLGTGDRARLRVADAVARLAARLAAAQVPGMPTGLLRRAAPVLQRQTGVQVPPELLFGRDNVVLRGRLDRLLLVASHDSPETDVEPADGDEVTQRMLASLAQERGPFMAYYQQFRFAFPALSSSVVERVAELERELAAAYLSGVDAWWLRHPYPVQIAALHRPVLDLLAAGASDGPHPDPAGWGR